ncbi:hypothetical protein [Streptomyces cyaneofuscatus]|uniref:hypothetical protein n=1 Tax=Streptomyces cyaneofuscatus TaxID=66883 RepID=UPI00379C9856
MATVLLTIALVVVVALLVAAGAMALARLDDVYDATALRHGAAAFAACITLAAAVATALAAVLR